MYLFFLFQLLLVSSAFMSPAESRNGTDLHRVRMFGPDKLNKNVAEQKWDRLKVICNQPFNPKMQYGLSFITARSVESVSKIMNVFLLLFLMYNKTMRAFLQLLASVMVSK